MGLIESMRAVLTSPAPKNRSTGESAGAYWCDDCDVRIRDVDLEGKRSDPRGAAPTCPDCGDEMRFERSVGRDCAC